MRKSSHLNHSAPPPAAQDGGAGPIPAHAPPVVGRPEAAPVAERAVEAQPPTQVVVPARRRTFPADYKLRVLEELDACRAPGEVGAVLRREGLYSSSITTWRELRKKGVLTALSDVRRGRRPKPADGRELERLRAENRRLAKRLERAELLLELQKKVSEVLGIPLSSRPSDENDS